VAKKIKVSEVEKGQRVRVETRNGMKDGEVIEVREGKGDEGEPASWVTVGRPNGAFIDSMHAPDGEIELAGD
jgi:hypothetical protein